MANPHYVIVGAGLAGAVLARELVEALDCRITIFEAKTQKHKKVSLRTFRRLESKENRKPSHSEREHLVRSV